MNAVYLTGYLPADAVRRCAPGGAVKLCFELRVRDSGGEEGEQKCFVDDAALVNRFEELLTAGRAVIAEGELVSRAWHDAHGVLKGFVREVRVRGLEVPNRGAARPARAQGGEEDAA